MNQEFKEEDIVEHKNFKTSRETGKDLVLDYIHTAFGEIAVRSYNNGVWKIFSMFREKVDVVAKKLTLLSL